MGRHAVTVSCAKLGGAPPAPLRVQPHDCSGLRRSGLHEVVPRPIWKGWSGPDSTRRAVELKTLGAVVLLLALPIRAEAGWVLLAPDPRGSFDSAVACSAEAAAWQARAQEGARWVVGQYQQALQQKDQAVITFWRQAVHRAAGQIEQARAARCVEVMS